MMQNLARLYTGTTKVAERETPEEHASITPLSNNMSKMSPMYTRKRKRVPVLHDEDETLHLECRAISVVDSNGDSHKRNVNKVDMMNFRSCLARDIRTAKSA
jgi:hypothetical protein